MLLAQRPTVSRAGPRGPVRGRKAARGAAVAVLVIGLVITAILAVVTFRGHVRTERKLLVLQTKLIADAGAAEDQLYAQDLGGAARLAAATDGNTATFTKNVSTSVTAKGPFIVESLWRLRGSSPRLITAAGGTPLLAPTSARAAAVIRQATASKTFVVSELATRHELRLGLAAAASGPDGTFVVYAEEAAPADRRISEPASSPVSALDFALYLGRAQTSAALLETDAPARLPLRGTTFSTRIRFGNTFLTITTSPRSSLSGTTGVILPWAIAIGGVLLTILAALLTERLTRRRASAERLAGEIRQLYVEQRSVAETLQQALLPQKLAEIPGMQLAARYLPGAAGVDIGGDWYDVVPVDDRQFVFIVGDVSGRGVRAAAVMASLQFAGRAYALEGHSPATILDRLARSLDLERDGHFATVLCGLVDVGAHTVLLANAGHLPPLVCSGGEARLVTIESGSPIGISGGASRAHAEVKTGANDVLIAYTDGLVERRGEILDAGLERLQKAASRDFPSLDDMLSSIVTELSGDEPTDDIALIGLQWLS
jgi:serine phosphatase RsbU (regulator of sigma subunit)